MNWAEFLEALPGVLFLLAMGYAFWYFGTDKQRGKGTKSGYKIDPSEDWPPPPPPRKH